MPPNDPGFGNLLSKWFPWLYPPTTTPTQTTGGLGGYFNQGQNQGTGLQLKFDEYGTPWVFDPNTGSLTPMPSGQTGTLPMQNQMVNLYKQLTGKDISGMLPWQSQYNWPNFNPNMGRSAAHYAFQYDPFSQQLQAAQLQESIRQANLAAGYDRSKLLNDVLANPANVFSSWFQSRGQVPPYNAQLANILNLNTPEGGAGSPWFGAMPPLGQTPGIPGIPTPQPPQPIPYAQGGTYIPAEPAVAIGLRSGQPLFTFNENAPAQTENVKITPQKTPSFAEGGTAWTDPSVGMGGQFRGTGAGQIPLSGVNPAPLADLYGRGFPQFPWLTSLGQGGMPGLPQLGNSLSGFPVPSLQSLNQMAPSEQAALANYFNTVHGVPAADVGWAARLPFNNLRTGIPAQNRMG